MTAKLKQDAVLRGWMTDHDFKDVTYKIGSVLSGDFILDGKYFFVYDDENDLEFWIKPDLITIA